MAQLNRKTLLATAVTALLIASGAQAQISDDVVRIGVMADMTGPYAGNGGPGSTLAVRMADLQAVQEQIAAKQQRLEEVGDDPQARARIEAAFDAVLMDRLKERQQGKVSSAALNASQREAARPSAKAPPARPSLPSLPSLPALPKPSFNAPSFSVPTLALAEGPQRWLPVGVGAVLLGLLQPPPWLLVPAFAIAWLLGLSTWHAVLQNTVWS